MKLERVSIIDAIKRLIVIFSEKSRDRGTLDELYEIANERTKWVKAHDLFQRIRQKNLNANRQGDAVLESQFRFEEVCAKTLYNLTHESAPFDPDAPYWIVPNAFVAARHLGIESNEIILAITQN